MRTTPSHYAFCIIVIVPVEKQINFAPFWCPVGISCLLISAKL